jgi:hypothetical protein
MHQASGTPEPCPRPQASQEPYTSMRKLYGAVASKGDPAHLFSTLNHHLGVTL